MPATSASSSSRSRSRLSSSTALNFVANEDFSANPKTPGIFSVNTDAPTYRDDLYRATMAARTGAALAYLFLGA